MVECILGTEVDASWLEIGIEGLLCFPVAALEMVEFVFSNMKRGQVSFWTEYLAFPVFDGIVQKTVADKVHKSVLIHAWGIVREHVGMFLDETDDIEILLHGRLETAKTVARDNELVATNASAFAVQAHKRRITQTVTSVQRITCINQHVLYADSVLEIVVGELCHLLS